MSTHYLRNGGGKTVVDVEVTKDDLSCVVVIAEYSYLLLLNSDRTFETIKDFAALQELRGEYWEKNTLKETPTELVSRRLREIATKYKLEYVVD